MGFIIIIIIVVVVVVVMNYDLYFMIYDEK
jgi:Tfp pilus assembly protein PilO